MFCFPIWYIYSKFFLKMFKGLINSVGTAISTYSTSVSCPISNVSIVGEKISSTNVFEVYDGIKRNPIDGGQMLLSVFVCNKKNTNSSTTPQQVSAARNCLTKLKTLRVHPNILKLVDSDETDSGIFIATERVREFVNGVDEHRDEVVYAVLLF